MTNYQNIQSCFYHFDVDLWLNLSYLYIWNPLCAASMPTLIGPSCATAASRSFSLPCLKNERLWFLSLRSATSDSSPTVPLKEGPQNAS